MIKKPSFFKRIWSWICGHKIWTIVIVAIIIFSVYSANRTANKKTVPQYTLTATKIGTLQQTINGTGQVSASNQTDIQSQVSGTITSITAKVGQKVSTGDLIATIDPKNALIQLQTAKISLAKLTEPAKASDISNATNNLDKAYDDAFNAISSTYLDLPSIVSGMKELLYSQDGFLSNQHYSMLSTTAQTYIRTASTAYDLATNEYLDSLNRFKNISRTSPRNEIESVLDSTSKTIKDMGSAVTQAQNALTFITTNQSEYNPTAAASAANNINTWASQANNDVSALISAKNNISSNKNSLVNLRDGADDLDIQSAELNLEQARQTYANYFIKAPYDGIIGRIPVNVFGQAGGGTVIATIVGQQNIATISLNEVDAAKVRPGQDVLITFDAIDGLNATGTVSQVDQVGSVSQGVVSYGVKININTQDERIRPGMSVNTNIITNQQLDVLLVPSTAIKSQGNLKYVQTFDKSVLPNSAARTINRTITVSPTSLPKQVVVTTGDSDDTNTIITSGLQPGQLVVTRTVSSGSTQATAPNIFSTLGANRGPGGTTTTRNTGTTGTAATGR